MTETIKSGNNHRIEGPLKGRFAPGNNANPDGRPKGQTLKEFAKAYLLNLPPEQKTKYLSELPFEIVWKMAEGNPHSSGDIVVKEPPKPILGGKAE